MSRSSEPTNNESCSFCEKSRAEVETIIAGPPGTYICSGCVDICNSILDEDQQRLKGHASKQKSKSGLEETENLTPREIVEKLGEYVYGQKSAKKALAVAVYNHYKRINSSQLKEENAWEDVELEKSNVLLVGPTGSGKTLLARTLAKVLNVPFAIADATTLTEAGYVGEDVENILLKLIQAADHDLENAKRGIIYIDEIDKISRTTSNVSITRDVSGEGVQQALLKILEGSVANVPPQGGRKHPEQELIPFDTSGILFVVGGTFAGIEETIAKRIGESTIGFEAKNTHQEKINDARREELLPLLETGDLVEYGLIPEFVGRLPVHVNLSSLNEEDLVHILTEPKNAIIKQFQAYFAMEGHELEFGECALKEIASQAMQRETGVRALRSIVEKILQELMYRLPDEKGDAKRFVITGEMIRSSSVTALLESLENPKRESA